MIQDLHSHTYYSFCGHDTPEAIVEAAIAGGIDILGICDHNYGVALQHRTTVFPDQERRARHYQRAINTYLDHISLIKAKYQDQIRVLCGLEISTLNAPNRDIPDAIDLSRFDYCLIESLGDADSFMDDLFTFAERCGCAKTGIAHTDLFAYLEKTNQDPYAYLTKMAERNIFWELNVNFDSTHHYRRHQYVLDFFTDPSQQELVRNSGIELSIGFDGHRVEDYRPDIIKEYCQKAKELAIPLVFLD